MSREKLTLKQDAFVREYLVDKNATQAAIRAGYSARTAEWIGPQLLGKTHVKTAIDAGLAEVAERLSVSAERTLQEIARLALFDIRKLFNPDGSMKPVHELDDDTAAAIASLEIDEIAVGAGEERKVIGYTKKLKLWDKNAALEKLMKHLGGYEKDNNQKTNPLAELLTQLNGNVLGVAKAREE